MKTPFPMTKSPRAVAQEALRLAQEALPAYSCKTSRKDFTQHQLFALLALKTFFKADYRGLVQLLAEFSDCVPTSAWIMSRTTPPSARPPGGSEKTGSSSCSSARPLRAPRSAV